MKKILTLTLVLFGALALTGCATDEDAVVTELTGLTENESIATMAYLSSGLLNFTDTTPVVSATLFLADEDELEIEEELDEVNQYMEQLKVFMNEGTDNFGQVTELESDLPEYEFKLEFTVQGELYVVYYNIDAETGLYTGIVIINEVTYELEAGYVEEVLEGQEPGEGEELQQRFRFMARNGDDFVEIEYKKELEEGETTLKFNMYEYKNNVERNLEMKISHEENEMKIQIEEDGNEFSFKKNVEDGETVYKLQYKVNETEGEVNITETENEFGEFQYQYQVKEQGRERNYDMDEPDHKDDAEYEHSNQNGVDDDDDVDPEPEPEPDPEPEPEPEDEEEQEEL